MLISTEHAAELATKYDIDQRDVVELAQSSDNEQELTCALMDITTNSDD